MSTASILHVIGALGLAGFVAFVARAGGALSPSGALAATIVGWAALMAGWAWSALLTIYFLTAATLSRWRRAAKEERTQALLEKGAQRDWIQVLANGGLFALAAVAAVITGREEVFAAIGGGALAASAADSWGTEVGLTAAGEPRSLLSWKRVPAGTSGGVSGRGSAASVAGAVCIGLVCVMIGWRREVAIAAVVGGIVGALADSIIGGTLQSRRRCTACGMETEQMVHRCGGGTLHHRGLRGLNNDAVNLAATIAGALAALAVCAILSRSG